ncbi:MAG: hypothetical protein M1827_006216 [Pycnora praestabilis]|nr:MAG: hypothetical protein M1827_006216 [Pycnora praestabilis]
MVQSTSLPQNPTSGNVSGLLPKLQDADPDFRYMSLNDLYELLTIGHPGFLANDYSTCARTVDGLLKTLDDQNGEVQNLAIKCLAPLVLKVHPDILPVLIEKLSNLRTQNAVDNSIPTTALRTVVTTFPRPIPGMRPGKSTLDAYSSISKVLIPRLVGYVVIPHGIKNHPQPPRGMLETSGEMAVDSDAIDVLIEVGRCFGPMLQDAEVRALQKTVSDILDADRTGSVVKKKAVVAISILAAYFSDHLLSSFVSHLIESFRNPHLTLTKRRVYITIVGSIAKSIPQRFGPYLKTLAPFVLSAVSEQEFDDQMKEDASADGEVDPEVDDVREAALVALEGFLSSCGSEMRPFTVETIDAALRYLKYDPNVADDEDDEEMGGTQSGEDEDETDDFGEEDEDFEEEGGFSDDDDMSWKVRRCAAKVLYILISTRANGDLLDDGTLYERVAPELVNRFKEREESVKLEVLATMSSLVRKTGEGTAVLSASLIDGSYASLSGLSNSRKRRRGGSDASMFDTQAAVSLSTGVTSPTEASVPASGARADLAEQVPAIVREITKLLKGKSISTKQAAMSLLKDIVNVQHGGLSEYLNQIVDPVIDTIKVSNVGNGNSTMATTAGGAASATGSSLRIEALQLMSSIAETHPSSVLLPYLGKLVSGIVVAVQDSFYKVSSEALAAIEQLVKVLSPPRLAVAESKQRSQMGQLYDVIIGRTTANDADLEVRQRAIHALGVLLARTSGPDGANLVTSAKKSAALDLLDERLRNETTRLAAVRAIDAVAAMAVDKKEFTSRWVREVSLELGAQLRKSNRSLRGASLGALKNLVVNPAGRANLDDKTVQELVNLLLPSLTANDLHLLGPALVVLAHLIQGNAAKVVNDDMNTALCRIVLAPLSGAVLDALLILVKAMGELGLGGPFMQSLLKDIGVNGDPAVVGKVIGILLVYGKSTVGVRIDDFIGELNTAQDDQRKCLALSVLGEAGLRLGSSSPLQPNLFMSHFKSKSEQVPLAAAVALGRAGAGNVEIYLPIILSPLANAGSTQYLLLHSIKEILQEAGQAGIEISPYTQQIWDKLLSASQAEDNKAVGAECIGRLTIIDPKTYLPMLQVRKAVSTMVATANKNTKTFLKDKKASVRGMVIQALRYTFADSDESYDEVLKPNLTNMLTIMLNDSDLENRRLALTTLNSATHNKPHLILPHLGPLLPLVMKESNIKPELIREVQMGPFKHKVDDGLEVRKSAYETLYALMETAFSRINILELFDRVIAGLDDEHDIRVLCNLMLTKLIILDPEETVRRLDPIAERFRVILSFKPKENAVKQEIEKAQEASGSVIRVTTLLNNAFPGAAAGAAVSASNQPWRGYWEWIRRDYSTQLKAVEDDGKQKDH